jgi:WD40 repeat protein
MNFDANLFRKSAIGTERPKAFAKSVKYIFPGTKSWFVLWLAALLILGSLKPALSQTKEPILRMELGTHNATIFGLASDTSNRILVTGSEDKTVRVWDISDAARLVRILRPPVGEGEQGQIFSVALAPDGRTIACGGRTGAPKKGEACVYLFDKDTGALSRRLGGLPGWVQHLAYTADGRFLAAVTSERGGRANWTGLSIFRLPDYTLVAEDRDYGNYIRWVESDPSGTKLASSCFDGLVRLYDLSALQSLGTSSPATIAPVSKIRPSGGQYPWGLAFSPDGTRLAVGFNLTPKVDVLEIKGNTLAPGYAPDTTGATGGMERDFMVVAWSSDDRFLYAGGGHRLKKERQIRKWSDGGRGKYRDLPVGVDLPIHSILPVTGGGIFFASRDGSFGIVNDRDETKLLSPKVIPIYAANEKGLLVSPDGSAVQFAYERGGKSSFIFSVYERQLMDTSSNLWDGLKASFTFQAPITDGLEISDWETSLTPKLKGRPLQLNQEVAKCLAIKSDLTGFLIGTTTALRLFDSAGKVLWQVRMPGVVWGVNTDGRIVLAALGDGTIRWYRLTDGEEILALFPHPDRRRWILWTPSGHYDASAGGEDFIGWHVNNGKEQAADFFPVSRFRSTFYRPDVIDRVLKTLDEQEAIRLANEDHGRQPKAKVSVIEKLPPVVSISEPVDGAQVSTTSVRVRYSVRSNDPLTKLVALVDGRPASVGGGDGTLKEIGDISVPIPSRNCEVSVIAENRHAASEPATIRLRWKGATVRDEFEIKPKLYVLTVGVSVYQDPDLRLNLAAKDALDFGSAWNEQRGRLYSGVEVKTLTDAQASKGNILDGLEWLQRQVTAKDIAVLFFAGHGINDPTGVFYFLPVDADLDKLKRTGISQSDITSTVAAIAGKVLVFMDACHSGNLVDKVKRRGVVVVSSVVNELASAENGAVVFSSATGRQYALENADWGNGAFTKGLVEGIRGKADYTSTGRITVNMLDLYVSERVKELTKGQQTPTTVKPPNVPDFPVALVR